MSDSPEPQKRGRPKGSTGKSAKFRHYQPKKWTPVMEAIVLGGASGKSNKDLAKIFGYTETHISNIMCCEMAERVRDEIRKNLGHKEIADRLKAIREKAVERVENFLNNDQSFTNAPVISVDRAFRALELTNDKIKSPSVEVNINNNTAVLAKPENVDRLISALELSGGPIKVIEPPNDK